MILFDPAVAEGLADLEASGFEAGLYGRVIVEERVVRILWRHFGIEVQQHFVGLVGRVGITRGGEGKLPFALVGEGDVPEDRDAPAAR